MKQEEVATSVRVPKHLYAWVKEEADRRQWSINKMFVNIVREAKEKG